MKTHIAMSLTGMLLLAALAAARAADDPSPEPPADMACRLDSGAGTLTPISKPGGTLVRISGAGYTGNATCTFKTAAPGRLKFCFAGLSSLQTLTITDGKHTYSGQILGASKMTRYYDRLGRLVTDPALAAVTMVLETNKTGEVEATLSAAKGVELGKELKIHWRQLVLRKKG
jgi:hypothetical protein